MTTNSTNRLEIERRLTVALEKRFPDNEVAVSHFGGLLSEYAQSGLSSPHLVSEIETGEEGKLWSNVWEAILYRHLHSTGLPLRNIVKDSAQHGPDFCTEQGGRTIWIEAIVPSPDGIPADYLEPPPRRGGAVRAKRQPDQERVLRCTSAVAAKQAKFALDRIKGIVGPNDCTVIAVNICRLSDHDIDGTGISQFPLTMEAVFPIGPIGVPIFQDGRQAGQARNIPRFSVTKTNGREIGTAAFLDSAFANVSAVLQAFQRDIYEKDLILSTIHYPLATNPLPTGLFGARQEFVAEERGDDYQVIDIAAPIKKPAA